MEMRTNSLETTVIGQFLGTLEDRKTELPYSQSSRPMLYLKYWGSDYPYLQGRERQNRCLPVVVKSPPSI
jgi:hypothetical protein